MNKCLLVGLLVVLGCSASTETFQQPFSGTLLQFKKGELYYTPPVTEQQARTLGEYLVKENYFDDRDRRMVQLTKTDATFAFKMIVKNGIEQDQIYISSIKALPKDF